MAIGYGTVVNASNRVFMGNASISSLQSQVAWSTYSDARVKNNVQENVAGIDFIKALRPVTYNYDIHKENELMGVKATPDWDGKYDVEKIQFSGFIAQEVEEAARKVGYNFSGVDKPKNDKDLYSLRYSEFVVPLVKAVQEQQQTIETMEKQNEEQKKLVTEQQRIINEMQKRLEKLEGK